MSLVFYLLLPSLSYSGDIFSSTLCALAQHTNGDGGLREALAGAAAPAASPPFRATAAVARGWGGAESIADVLPDKLELTKAMDCSDDHMGTCGSCKVWPLVAPVPRRCALSPIPPVSLPHPATPTTSHPCSLPAAVTPTTTLSYSSRPSPPRFHTAGPCSRS